MVYYKVGIFYSLELVWYIYYTIIYNYFDKIYPKKRLNENNEMFYGVLKPVLKTFNLYFKI